MINISIIVPIYNAERYLNRCVDSLLNQDIDKNQYEIILVDDGSKDGSCEMCTDYCRKNSNIIFIQKENGGAASARNVGLNSANGKYIMFVDSDDCIKKNILKQIFNVAEINNTEICAYEMEQLDEFAHVKYINQPFKHYQLYEAKEIIYTMNIATACAALYLRSFLDKYNIRFTEGIVNEDVDFNNRAYSLVKRMLFTDIILYTYYWNSNSVNRSGSTEKIKKRNIDDLQVAYNGIKYAEQCNLPTKMKTFFRQKANSLVVSQLLGFFMGRIPNSIKQEYIEKAKSLGLFPIKGRTLSWKTTLVGKLLNIWF